MRAPTLISLAVATAILAGCASSSGGSSGGVTHKSKADPLAGLSNMVAGLTAKSLDVPGNARDIAFGLLLQNRGEVWADGLAFEVVDPSVPTTGSQPHALPAAPVNLQFAR